MMEAVDFAAARDILAGHLGQVFADVAIKPTVEPFGWESRDYWAPEIEWGPTLGVYIYLVNKKTGELTALSFPEFVARPQMTQVGPWPANRRIAA